MKLVKLSTVGFILVVLSGCSTLGAGGKTDSSLNEDGVIVEDRGVSSDGLNGVGVSGSDFGDGSERQVTVGDGSYGGGLDDPANALSNRIVYFEYDSSSVRAQDQATLEAHAAYLAEHPTARVRLEGHTDQRGSREYNLALGERRALAIRQILMIQGASINQFQITSFGEERPQNEEDHDAAWQQNRRVELIYTGS